MRKLVESIEEQFFLNNLNMETIFRNMDRTDYYFLHYIKGFKDQLEPDEKMYLSLLRDEMDIPMSDVSKAMHNLQDKEYIMWKTDSAAGKSYVELTSKSIELLNTQKEYMKKGYLKVLEKIGKEELEKTISTMMKIKNILGEMAIE